MKTKNNIPTSHRSDGDHKLGNLGKVISYSSNGKYF